MAAVPAPLRTQGARLRPARAAAGGDGEERVDVGNLYRVLRALEEQGLVSSEWDETLPGPAKRTYELTEAGGDALDRWAASLAETRTRIDRFLHRHQERG